MIKKRFASVWDAIEDNPEEAEKMKTRADLLLTLKRRARQAQEVDGKNEEQKKSPQITK
jgi:predicted XRE-type DNA-binding protein